MKLRRHSGAAELRLRAALRDRVHLAPARSLLADPEPASEPAPAPTVSAAAPPPATPGSVTAEPLADFTPIGASLLALPTALRGGILDPRRKGALALAGLALVAAAAAGGLALRARPQATRLPRPVQRVEPVASSSAKPTLSAVLVIDVAGAVRRPGLQRLPAGSRVADALAAAGGVTPGTPTTDLNLARKLVDGEQVLVGMRARAAAAAGPAAGAAGSGPINLNTATPAELDTLPGVGPVLAQRIINWRDEHGGFASVDQLREVEGIGDRTFGSLRPRVTV